MNGNRAIVTYFLIVLLIWVIVTGRVEAGFSVIFGEKDKNIKTETPVENYPSLPTMK